MISLAIATALAAAQASGPALLPRKNYGACLNKFMKAKVSEKLDEAGFRSGAKTACAAEEAAFRDSLIAFDLKMKIKRAEAEDNASTQVEDYLVNAVENYQAHVGGE
jgi:hypothetical protein